MAWAACGRNAARARELLAGITRSFSPCSSSVGTCLVRGSECEDRVLDGKRAPRAGISSTVFGVSA